MKLIFSIMKYRSIPLNLLFAGYLIFAQPIVIRRLSQTEGFTVLDPFIGWSMFGLQIIELFAVYLKLPVSAFYFKYHFNQKIIQNRVLSDASVGCLLFPWIFHMLVAIVLGLLALNTVIGDSTARDIWMVVLVFLIIIKESVFMALNNPLLGTGDPQKPLPGDHPLFIARMSRGIFTTPAQITPGLALRDLLGDLLLLVYLAVTYTILWDANPFFTGSAWGMDWFALMYFLILNMSLRSIYFMQDIFLDGSWRQKLVILASFLVALSVSMLTLPWR